VTVDRPPPTAEVSPLPRGRLERFGTAFENALLVVLLGAMVLLAVAQIVLRMFFDAGLIWADELLKIMVLWIALIASVAASRNQRHLRIDILSRFLPLRFVRLPGVIVSAFASLVCGIVAFHSWRYVRLTLEFDDTVLIDTPAWMVQGVLPVAFLLMSYHFAVHCVRNVAGLFRDRRGRQVAQ
jgi:TRAP-type C4-dicarboxylate transport system permease small subunit